MPILNDDFKFPDKYKPKPKASKKETDSSLSLKIKKHIEDNGGICDIIKTSGTFVKGKEVKINTGGFYNITLQKSKSFYHKSNATSGASDNSIVMYSNSGTLICWKCENKICEDYQKPNQKAYEDLIKSIAIKLTKGVLLYSIVKTFDDFIDQYDKLKAL